ncbi:MAG: DUF924 family protein [Myxococcota bacterium]
MNDVLQYWFSDPARWFAGTAEIDADVRARFAELHAQAAAGALDGWSATPEGAVALAVVLDQFSRHLFRGDAGMFATDSAARAAAEIALASPIPPDHRAMMALCLVHAEDPALAARGVAELETVVRSPDARAERKRFKRMYAAARRHLRTLERFGRYPHRNALLGRETTDDEAAWLAADTSKAARSVRPHARTRLRLLVLHSFRQSGRRLASRLRKLERDLEDIAELVYVDAPHVYVPDADERAMLESDFGAVPDFGHQRAWWHADDEHRTYAGWEDSIRVLDEHLPADGVLGFSQGGAVAGLLAALRTDRLRFAICVSGFPSRADAHRMLTVPGSIDLPSLHVYGQQDVLVDRDRTLQLAACFVEPRVVSHPGGHFFPELWPTDTFRTFLLPFLEAPPPPRALDLRWTDGRTDAEIGALLPSDPRPLLAEARGLRPRPLGDRIVVVAWSRAPDAVRDFLATDDDWPGLVRLAVAGAAHPDLVDAIAARFADRIVADEPSGLSLAAESAPRTGSATDRRSGLGRRIAAMLRPELPPVAAYIEYRRRIVRLSVPVRLARRRARFGREATGPTEGLSSEVTRPRPVPMVPCAPEELEPLLAYLSSREPPVVPRTFARGTVMPDGRLDLCKQVVGPAGIGPLLSALADNVHVDRVLLGNNVVGRDGAIQIARFVRSGHSKVNVWYIAGNEIDAEGLAPICDALAHAPSVHGLWLKRNPLGPDGAVPIASLLRADSPLETLDLVNTGLLDDGALAVIEALRHHRALRHLYLGTNGLGPASARALEGLLAEVDRLESVFVDCNRFGDEGAAILAEGLRKNRHLRRLSLASNRIGPAGAEALCDALADHPSLVYLNLGWTRATSAVREEGNRLGDAGCLPLADLLRRNRVIRALDVAHNGIGQAGLDRLREALVGNTTVVSLRHPQYGKATNPDRIAALRGLVERNRRAAGLDADGVEAIRTPRPTRDVMSVYRTAAPTP